MGGKSVFTGVMLVVIAVILILGFYFAIDALDLLRQRTETVALNLAQLRGSIEKGGVRAADSGGHAQAQAQPKFANDDLRDPNAVEGDSIVSAMQSEPLNLNAITNNDGMVGIFWGMCTDDLADRSYRHPEVFEPKMAESWEISPDKLTWTIHLRHGILWQDFTDPTTGKRYEPVEVTADDFKFYVEVLKNPGIPCDFMRNYYEFLKELRVVNKYTFQVIWSQPYWKTEELTLGLNPLPRHFYQFDPAKPDEFTDNSERNRMIVGCGPWVFEKWEKGQEIRFRRNETYYASKPYLMHRIVKVIKDPTAQLLALKSGQIDRMALQPEQWVDQTKDPEFDKKFAKFRYPSRGFNYIGYNLQHELFKDKRVRQALTMLVNRDRILKEVFLGMGRIVTGPFYIDSPSYDKDIKPWPYDPERAKALLKEAGWTSGEDGVMRKDGKRFEFTYMTITGAKLNERIAAIVQDDFAKAGIVVNINPLEWSVYLERLENRSFDVCQLGWGLGWEDDPYQIWHSSQIDAPHGSNHVGFRSAEVDKLIEDARGEFDPAKRTAMYHRLDQILHEEQPYTFLIDPDALVGMDRRFHNAEVIQPMNEMDVDVFWVPKDEQKHKE